MVLISMYQSTCMNRQMMNVFAIFYEQSLGKVCRLYWIGYVYRFKYFIRIGLSEYRLKAILVQYYNYHGMYIN